MADKSITIGVNEDGTLYVDYVNCDENDKEMEQLLRDSIDEILEKLNE